MHTKIKEIKTILGNDAKAFMYAEPDWFDRNEQLDGYGLLNKHPNWMVEDMYDALNRLEDIPHHVDWLNDHLGVIVLENDNKQNMILLAGGGYGCVCTWAESLCVAIEAFKKGFTVYLPSYAIAQKDLFPKPLDDLSFLLTHYNITSYWIGGFSAGAHLSAYWSSKKGCIKYNLPLPQRQILVYPLVLISNSGDDPALEKLMADRIGGNPEEYNIDMLIDKSYPKTYIIRGKDDATLGPKHCEYLIRSLKENDVAYLFEEFEHADHGFSAGGNTDAKGWFETAYKYLKQY